MASINEVSQRQYEIYSKEEFLKNNLELIRDFTCKFVLYLDNVGVNPKLNLNEALQVFEKYYDEHTDISGNDRNL